MENYAEKHDGNKYCNNNNVINIFWVGCGGNRTTRNVSKLKVSRTKKKQIMAT